MDNRQGTWTPSTKYVEMTHILQNPRVILSPEILMALVFSSIKCVSKQRTREKVSAEDTDTYNTI